MQPNDSNATRLSLLLRLRDLEDADAWDRFVETYGPYVARWCSSMGMQDADAADTTQSVLMKLLTIVQSWEYQPTKGSFRGWLKKVTHNVAIDLQRSWKTRAAGDSAVIQRLLQIPDESIEDSLWRSVELAYQNELLKLAHTNVQRRVLEKTWNAYYCTNVLGESASEVAASLDMPIGEVYVARSRVMKLIKSEVAKLESQQGSDCDQD